MKKLFVAPFCFLSLTSSLSQLMAEVPIAAEKTAATETTPVDFYGSLQVRQYEAHSYDQSKRTKTTSLLSFAPGFGAKLMNDQVDTFFRVRYGKSNQSEALQSVEAFNETFVYLYKNDFFTTGPYAFSSFDPSTGRYESTNLGVDFSANHSMDFSFGGIKLAGFVRPMAQIVTQGTLEKNKIKPTGGEAFSLSDENIEPVERRDMAYLNEMELALGYAPAFIPATTVKLAVFVSQEWNPTYKIQSASTNPTENTDFDSYKKKELSLARLIGSYKITDQTAFDAEIRQYWGGIFDYEIDSSKAAAAGELTSKRLESRLSLTTSFD